MEKFKQFLKGFFVSVTLLVVFYLLLQNREIATMYHIPLFSIPFIALFITLAVGLHIADLRMEISKIEYEFTSIVNHTFRTPLTAIMWMTKELEKEDLSQNEKLLILQKINNANNKVLEIVDLIAGIKNINNTSGYFFEATSLRTVVEKTISKYREEINKKGLNFKIPTFQDVPLLTVDLKKISFVIDTLIENAIFYTPKGGNVLMECLHNSKHITLYVADNGMGLNMRDKMRIFARFYRSKEAVLMNPDGMGLRLYLSRQIVKRHNGTLEAKSEGKNKGTTFVMKLPFSRKSTS